MLWVFDLDGVLWRGETPIAGAVEAIIQLREGGHHVGFCTNNSSRTRKNYRTKLERMGIVDPRLISSAMAGATLVNPGERVLVAAGTGVREAVEARGAIALDRLYLSPTDNDDTPDVDVVVVGFHPEFDYDGLNAALQAVHRGARLVATNSDPVFPHENGVAPGGGSLVAAVECATGVTATVAGKPFAPMGSLMTAFFANELIASRDEKIPAVFVGDTIATDGNMARALGWPFGLVGTGNTNISDLHPDRPAGWIASDVYELVAHVLSGAPFDT